MAKAALITGGARRIGKAIALSLAGMGYDIALHYRSSKKGAEEAARSIREAGVECRLFRADLSVTKDVEALVPAVCSEFPDLGLLVNNASIFERARLMDTGMELFDRHFQVNFKAPFFLSQAFAASCERGHIINLLDTKISGKQSAYFAYALTKKGLAEFTLMAARELGPGIRVNGIAPGLILPSFGMSQDEFEKLARHIPLRRIGSPERIVQAVRFLEENPFVTGELLYVDGGEHLK